MSGELDEESEKRSEMQVELNGITANLTVLRTREKQLKSDCTRALEEKKQAQDALNKLMRFVNYSNFFVLKMKKI